MRSDSDVLLGRELPRLQLRLQLWVERPHPPMTYASVRAPESPGDVSVLPQWGWQQGGAGEAGGPDMSGVERRNGKPMRTGCPCDGDTWEGPPRGVPAQIAT